MFWLIWGRRAYGRVDAHGGEHAHTVFFHIYYLPLIPTTSAWSDRPGRAFVTRWNRKSIFTAYLRMWGPIAAIGCCVAATVPSMLVGAGLAAVSAYAWFARGVSNTRRSDFNVLAFNTRCEPALMTDDVRATFKQRLDNRWQVLDPGRSPDEVAQLGARSLDEAVVAYGLLRIAAIEHRGAHALADRILRGELDPTPQGDGPYRDERDAPVAGVVVEQAQAAAAARRPAFVSNSHEPWWQFSANLLAATLVVAVVAGALIVTRISTLREPPKLSIAQLVAGNSTDTWAEVECDGLERDRIIGEVAYYECTMGDRAMTVTIDRKDHPHSPVVGLLSPDREHRFDGRSLPVKLEARSILVIRAIVIASFAYEAFFIGLIGFWLSRRFRRKPSL